MMEKPSLLPPYEIMTKRIFVQYGVKLRVCYQIWLKFAHNKAVDLPRVCVVASLQLCRVLVSVATSWVMMVHSCAVLLILRAKKENHPGLWLLKTAVRFRLCQNEVGS